MREDGRIKEYAHRHELLIGDMLHWLVVAMLLVASICLFLGINTLANEHPCRDFACRVVQGMLH